MPSSPIHRFPLSDSSTNNNYDCMTHIPSEYEEQEMDNTDKLASCRFNNGKALLHKQVERPILLQAPKSFGKRRYTFSGHQDYKVSSKKRRRVTSIALPTKFLLGGNINDPLNLSSLEDDSQQINVQHATASPPMPLLPYRKQVQVAIPQNIHDPLNLTTGEAIKISHSSKSRKRRRHRKGKRDDDGLDDGTQISPTEEVPPFDTVPQPEFFFVSLDDSNVKEIKNTVKIEFSGDQIASGKIVSPVIPQGSPVKTFKKSLSRSISKDINEKPVSNQFQKRAIFKSRKRHDAVKLRANAEKFCYGNHVTNMANWNFGCDYGIDPRLRFFNPELFRHKDILDIGCNAGQLTLHIARYWHPNKIIGVDIDKKLIDKAQQKIRFKLSEEIAVGNDFPDCMATMYGPLSKLVMSVSKTRREFPNNVTFFEPAIYKTYQGLEMRPYFFCEYLLSEVGFTSCQLIGRSYNSNKAYRQDIFLFTKGCSEISMTPREYSSPTYCDMWSEYYSNFEDEMTSDYSE
ncbi:7SK snRNA methylphosphate capping enzyme [Nephila pilipes]|uniref:RNA methyltransferase n=1 Tax=Nephila pilipes TaxID=299642 RepID=A0A8X6N8J6_NEPPI|nr:7SK snRNA methylphosphate capping enzyme [Nephila pilipes]